jgi:hypothetical protein
MSVPIINSSVTSFDFSPGARRLHQRNWSAPEPRPVVDLHQQLARDGHFRIEPALILTFESARTYLRQSGALGGPSFVSE